MDEEIREEFNEEIKSETDAETAEEINPADDECEVCQTEDEIEYDSDTEDGEAIGNIKISVEVVSTIAGIAASEIDGVKCMYTSFVDGFAQKIGAKKNASKGVKVDMSDDSVSIDLYIVVDYGVKIPELAWTIQENVKKNVETMTGMTVSKVNIHIEGISFDGTVDDASDTDEISD